MQATTAEHREARNRFAELLRQLASGRLTNDEFDDAYEPRTRDHVVDELFRFAWTFYDDLYEHRLRGSHRLSPRQRRVFARCVLFLRSGLPYEWPKQAKFLWCKQRDKPEAVEHLPWWKPDASALNGLPFCGRLARAVRDGEDRLIELDRKRRGVVDDRIWPFRRMSDYRAALRNPPYLVGQMAG